MKFPRSAYDKVGGMVYFARMTDKIRLQAAGELPPDYFQNLGGGMDLRTCRYLHIEYAALAEKVRSGMTDEQAFAWANEHGRKLSEVDLLIYNGFSTKRGLRDEGSAMLEEHKRGSGLGERPDIQTFFDYFDADEKRRPKTDSTMRFLPLAGLSAALFLTAAAAQAQAQAPAGTLPTVNNPVADFSLQTQSTRPIDLSGVFGLPSVSGPVVQFATLLGALNVELFAQQTPLTTTNFLSYVSSGAYNNTIFTRSVPGFVEQGGSYTISSSTGVITQTPTGAPVRSEVGISNTRGTIAMATTTGPDTGTDGWYFNLVNNDGSGVNNLNPSYTVFGRVLGTGMTVIDSVAAAQVANLSALLDANFATTPLINVPSSGNISVGYSNFIRLNVTQISIYPTATVPGVLAFSASSSNSAAVAVAVNGSTLNVTAGTPGSSAVVTATATDTNGNQATATFNVSVTSAPIPVPPAITLQPISQSVASLPGGTTVILTCAASGTPAPTYQWKLGSLPISGATGPRLVLPNATGGNAGAYVCVATNSAGAATTSPATVSFVATPNPGRLVNLSVNTTAGSSQVLTVGFVTGGPSTTGSQSLLFRATGPALAAFGVSGTLADPTLTLFSSSSILNSNDNWGTPAANQATITAADSVTGAFPLSNPASLDAALVSSLNIGGYTVQVSGNGAASGTALAEIYDNTGAYTLTTPRLINISSKNLIIAKGSMTAGFVIGGTTSKSVLLRATGPTLANLGVAGTMPDPQLALHLTVNGQDTVVASNAGWGGDAQISTEGTAVGAFSLASASKDSALLVMLAPGAYTAVASSVTGAAGVALIEVYEVP